MLLQDVSHNCQGQYNLLPMSQCADTAATPLGYTACNGSCTEASTEYYLYEPWGSCNATCGGGVQTRTGKPAEQPLLWQLPLGNCPLATAPSCELQQTYL